MLFALGILPSVRHMGILLLNNIKEGTDRTLYLSQRYFPTCDRTSMRNNLQVLFNLVSSLLTAGSAAVHASHQSE